MRISDWGSDVCSSDLHDPRDKRMDRYAHHHIAADGDAHLVAEGDFVHLFLHRARICVHEYVAGVDHLRLSPVVAASLFGRVLACFSAEMFARESLGCGSGLEPLILKRRGDQRISLRIITRIADGQPEKTFLILVDEKWAYSFSGHMFSSCNN